MVHGEQQHNQSTTPFEVINGSENGGEPTQAVAATVGPTAQEAKERVIERVEREMEIFRKGECSRFQASTRVANELEKWEGASEKERGKALDSFLAEINSFAAIQDEDQSATRGTSPPCREVVIPGPSHARKRIREEVDDLLDRVSQGELEGEEAEHRVARRRAKEEDMPWYKSSAGPPRRSSCIETSRILLQFSEDLSGVKSLL